MARPDDLDDLDGIDGIDRIDRIDRMVHEPARLAIMTVLSSVRSADFTFLQQVTGLTKGNLSSHLGKLEGAGLLTIDKAFVRKRSHTTAALTPEGRRRIAGHWAQLERLKGLADGGRAPDGRPT